MSGFSVSACFTDTKTDPANLKRGRACRTARDRSRTMDRRRSRKAVAKKMSREVPPGLVVPLEAAERCGDSRRIGPTHEKESNLL